MKFILYIIFFISLTEVSDAQYWIQRGGGNTIDEGMDIASDGANNTYTTGYFTATATFENNTTVNSAGLDDIFIAKTNSAGNLQWVKRAGGLNIDKALAIASDNAGNTVITGFYYATATFDAQSITSSGQQDAFIAKYNTSGSLIWLKSIGGTGSDIGNDVTIDNSGNIIVTGEFSGTCSFGTTTLVSQGGSIDVFTAKYDSNGNLLWAKKGSGAYTDRGTGVSTDATGNIYVSGMFSDTITFDVQHNNNIYNAMFVVKYNSSGVEQWCRWIGSGSNVNMGGISVHNNDINITGNFSSTLYFFGFTGNPTLSSTYPKDIFICRLDLSGNLIWSHTDGSQNDVTAKSIGTTTIGEVVIGGEFKCRMSDFSSQYGAGIFCSIGYWDTYVASYDNSGNRIWARQFGGKQNDYLNGLTVLTNNKIVETGSYEDGFCAAYKFSNFTFYGNPGDYNYILGIPNSYCSDASYGSYVKFISYGNSDIIINADIDLNREPLDYFVRTGATCNRPFNDICIGNSLADLSCPDTVSDCGSSQLTVDLNMNYGISPDFNYNWSTGSTNSSASVTNSGYYNVTVTTVDGCFSNRDTVYFLSHPIPAIPLISDSKGVNTNAVATLPVNICLPDSVVFTCTNVGANSIFWTGFPLGQNPVTVNAGGYYLCTVTSPFGCINQNSVSVITGSALPTVQPRLLCFNDTDGNDTIELCLGDNFDMYLYDQLSNPGGGLSACFPGMSTANWNTAGNISYDPISYCTPYSDNLFTPNAVGTFNYNITAWIVRSNPCATDSVFCSKHLVVIVHPVPSGNIAVSITGPTQICPGDSVLLIASPDSILLNWDNGLTGDSIYVSDPGFYEVSSSQVLTNSFGCSTVVTGYASTNISTYAQPTINMTPSNGLICPNDSVKINCSGAGNVNWQGPNGMLSSTSNIVYVNTAGFYYAIQTVAAGCDLVSNTVQVIQYNTPSIIAFPEPAICFGNPVTILIITNPASLIQWQSPLSGNIPSQIINSAGVYHCNVTSCGVLTPLSYTIYNDSAIALINSQPGSSFCNGDSVLLMANSGVQSYEWLPVGAVTQNIYINQPGNYSLITTSTYGCKDTATIAITEIQNNLTPPFVNDTLICAGNSINIIALSSDTVYWSIKPNYTTVFFTGTTYQTPLLLNPVTYYLYTKNELCKSRFDSVAVLIDDNCTPVFIPNVFSPNGDGVNDLFPELPDLLKMDIKIVNRWGALVFEGNDKSKGWDGRDLNGKLVPDGTYYYIINAGFYNGRSLVYKGFVTVISN